jgi:OmcA/MtrC family decaheme c-type cytochrome
MIRTKHLYTALPALLLLPWALPAATPAKSAGFTGSLKAKHLSGNAASFVRPGIQVKISSAAIAKDGTITARFNIADPKGLPLDMAGIYTPGTVNVRLIAAVIPAGKTQYFAYTTTTLKATINTNDAQVQAATDSGGSFAKNADGDYTYTFKTKAPAGFDATATHAIGISAQRDLSEFMTYAEWAETANDVFNFVPDGSPVKVTRAVTPTAACNSCHNPLFGHGGSRLTVEMCILCHSPQTVNPDTQLTQDMPVLIHKIHMGSSLPSVKAGNPYRIWHRGAWSDFSTVAFPQDERNCTACHANAPQADLWKSKPSRAACGACHDNVNFATGENHADLPQVSDNQCQTCHTSEASADFDLSIPGAHVVPGSSKSLPGIVLQVLKVENATPGNAPVVTFKVVDKSGAAVDISKLTQIRVLLSGPNTDYQTGPGGIRVAEDASKAPGSGGVYTYTMTAKVPAAAKGSYTVSMQARNSVKLMSGTKKETAATDSAKPVEYYFAVDNSKMFARRQVVSDAKCMACHSNLTFVHGGTRGTVQECTVCHNPSLVDGTSKQSVNFAWMIHSIHRGEGLANPYVLGTTNYQEVRFPGDVRDCNSCHVNNSYNPENVGASAPVASTGGFTSTTLPIAAACQGCHDDMPTASHALANTTTMGESCATCHSASADFSMDKVHSRTQ